MQLLLQDSVTSLKSTTISETCVQVPEPFRETTTAGGNSSVLQVSPFLGLTETVKALEENIFFPQLTGVAAFLRHLDGTRVETWTLLFFPGSTLSGTYEGRMSSCKAFQKLLLDVSNPPLPCAICHWTRSCVKTTEHVFLCCLSI